MNKSKISDSPKLSPTGIEILDFLRSRGGSGPVGIIGANRTTTIKHLRKLEILGLIECIQEPEKLKLPADYIGQEGFNKNCGLWKLTG